MEDKNAFEEGLEAQEKKHKKFIKYDFEALVVICIFVVVLVVVNFTLKADYKCIGKIRPEIAPMVIECNKSILNVAETFRKNSTDIQARTSVDAAKMSFDSVILYYGKTITKGSEEAQFIRVIDSCYMVAWRFRNILEAQKDLNQAEVSQTMIQDMDNDIKHVKDKADSLAAAVDSYNGSGFLLKLNWLTPYPGKIEYTRNTLPDLQPIVAPIAEALPKK